ncbi:MAG: glycosyltransferase family 4 protein [Acidimicrobiia bacterium]
MPAPSSPLRVAVDATPVIGERSGVGHATARLLAELGARTDVAVSGYAITRRGRSSLAGLLPAGVVPATSPMPARVTHRLWRAAGRPRIEHWTGAIDVVHATNFVAPPARAPVVVTVHDLTFVHHPELCRAETVAYEASIARSIDRGATVHVLSDAMGDEVREHFGLPEVRVARVYLGVDESGRDGDATSGRALAGAPRYVLALGTVEPRKNYPRLVAAFDAIAATETDFALVIAGGAGWGTDELDSALEHVRARDRVRVLGYVDDCDRADLLAGAHALAYPSLYEGFGLSPLEAMAAGVPVVTTRAGAIPEAVGDAALLADPLDVDDLAGALQRVCDDESLRADLVERGHVRVARFSWSRSAEEFVALYRRIAAS